MSAVQLIQKALTEFVDVFEEGIDDFVTQYHESDLVQDESGILYGDTDMLMFSIPLNKTVLDTIDTNTLTEHFNSHLQTCGSYLRIENVIYEPNLIAPIYYAYIQLVL